MKRFLLSILAVAVLGILTAGAEEFVLGGCNHKIASGGGYGSDEAGHISAAMYIPGSKLRALAGNSVSRIDVGLISRINVRDVNVWVRKKLDGENLAVETVERPTTGWNQITFAKPYLIESDIEGLYIGYDYENAGSSHPVSFTGDGSDYASYLKIGNGKWEDMSARGALSVEAVVTGSNLPQYDLAFLSGRVFPNLTGGSGNYTAAGEVANLALKNVSGFTLAISVNDTKISETHVDADIAKGSKGAFTANFTSGQQLSGEITLTISAIDGGKDADMTNNSIVTNVAFPKNVLVEEFTTERCPNCPEPGKWFTSVLESDPSYRTRVVPVCHHAAFGTDWLTRDCDTELLWLFNMDGKSFAPAAMFDRHAAFRKGLNMDKLEPIVALRSQKDFEDCIKAELEEETHAMVGLQISGLRGDEMDVTVKVATDAGFNLQNPILVVYVLEDGIRAEKQEGASGTYYHHHVIRWDNGSYGEAIELTDGAFEKVFTIALGPDWNKKNLSVAAFVANDDRTDVDNNAVENAAVLYLADTPAGTGSVAESASAQELLRYDIHGLPHKEAFQGLNIIVFTDGSVKKEFITK